MDCYDLNPSISQYSWRFAASILVIRSHLSFVFGLSKDDHSDLVTLASKGGMNLFIDCTFDVVPHPFTQMMDNVVWWSYSTILCQFFMFYYNQNMRIPTSKLFINALLLKMDGISITCDLEKGLVKACITIPTCFHSTLRISFQAMPTTTETFLFLFASFDLWILIIFNYFNLFGNFWKFWKFLVKSGIFGKFLE